MNSRTVLRGASAFAFTLLLSATAQAQLFRAYLASDGNDANPCTLPAPCRLLPAALSTVASGGEVWMLDSANYNTATVVIGKSVSILAVPGAVGSVLAINGPAVSIAAADLKVSLRNLVIMPLPGAGASQGVSMTGASTLTIEHSLIANLPLNGVMVLGRGSLAIANTIMRNNGQYAVILQEGASASISGTQMLKNGLGGVLAQSTTYYTLVNVSDSTIDGGNFGIYAYTGASGAGAIINVTRCTIGGTIYALRSEAGSGSAAVNVSSSMITLNLYGWYSDGPGAVMGTLGNNYIVGATLGSLTPIALK